MSRLLCLVTTSFPTKSPTQYAYFEETYPLAALPSFHIHRPLESGDPLQVSTDYMTHKQSASVPYQSSLAGNQLHTLFLEGRLRSHLAAVLPPSTSASLFLPDQQRIPCL